MSSCSCWGLPTALLALLCSTGSGVKTYNVYVELDQPVVEAYKSMVVNCSTDCPQPSLGGLETSEEKILQVNQTQWNQYLVPNISKDTHFECHFMCSGEQLSRKVNISVYHPPKQLMLKMQPTWVALGKLFTMECRLLSVAPFKELTLTLLRDREILHNQTFWQVTADPQEVTTTLNATAHWEDHRRNFSCQAKLDLRSHGGEIVSWATDSQMLEVYELRQDNQMIIIITVVSVLLFLFVTSVLLCFVFSQHWRHKRTGTYGVRAAWRRLSRAYRT